MTGPHPHGTEDLCEAGLNLYTRALNEGRVNAGDADGAPCPIDLGLSQPAMENPRHLHPADPALALHRLLRGTAERVAQERRREERLAAVFTSLAGIGPQSAALAKPPAISVLSGLGRIGEAIERALAGASGEMLAIQPQTHHTPLPPCMPKPWSAIRRCSTAVAVSAPSTSTPSATPPASSRATSASGAT